MVRRINVFSEQGASILFDICKYFASYLHVNSIELFSFFVLNMCEIKCVVVIYYTRVRRMVSLGQLVFAEFNYFI